MSFNTRLKEARLNAKMTQEQLGEIINAAKSTISGYEKGTSEPSVQKIYTIMSALGVDANFLWQDEMNEYLKKPPVLATTDTEDSRLKEITECYCSMNENGKESLYKQAVMHAKVDEYKKHSSVSASEAG